MSDDVRNDSVYNLTVSNEKPRSKPLCECLEWSDGSKYLCPACATIAEEEKKVLVDERYLLARLSVHPDRFMLYSKREEAKKIRDRVLAEAEQKELG